MEKEKILISRDTAVINEHRRILENLLPKYQQLIRLYFDLKLDKYSSSIPDIIRFAYSEIRETLRKTLPPSLQNTTDADRMTLPGEEHFLNYLKVMRKNGELGNAASYRINPDRSVEIDQEKLLLFEEEHSIWVADVRGKQLLELVIQAIENFEEYSKKAYRGVSLVNANSDGSCQLNPIMKLCDQDKKGKLTLNLKTLASFERTRI